MNAQSFVWVGLFVLLAAGSAQAEEGTWYCPDAQVAKAAFADGSAHEWPNYTEGLGARVQRQHPGTAFIGAQAKFIDFGTRTVGICQYYNHVGWVFTMVANDLDRPSDARTCKTDASGEAHCWRQEYVESYEKDDRPGQEQMSVCMQIIDGESFPSPDCPFTLPQ